MSLAWTSRWVLDRGPGIGFSPSRNTNQSSRRCRPLRSTQPETGNAVHQPDGREAWSYRGLAPMRRWEGCPQAQGRRHPPVRRAFDEFWGGAWEIRPRDARLPRRQHSARSKTALFILIHGGLESLALSPNSPGRVADPVRLPPQILGLDGSQAWRSGSLWRDSREQESARWALSAAPASPFSGTSGDASQAAGRPPPGALPPRRPGEIGGVG